MYVSSRILLSRFIGVSIILTSSSSYGGMTSPSPCPAAVVQCVSNLLQQGYHFLGGSDISAEQKQRVSVNTIAPPNYDDAKYKTGSIYLIKGNDLVICSYTVVTSNPRAGAPSAGDQAIVGSKCYEVK
jgi:hypothetical protein